MAWGCVAFPIEYLFAGTNRLWVQYKWQSSGVGLTRRRANPGEPNLETQAHIAKKCFFELARPPYGFYAASCLSKSLSTRRGRV
jgi:hypothetical protein